MANRQPMSYQRAWKRTRAVQREIENARRLDAQANPANVVIGSVNGYLIVRQADGGYTLQRGLRVRFAADGQPWLTREEAEAEAVRLVTENLQQEELR